jgi:hypothetical protein
MIRHIRGGQHTGTRDWGKLALFGLTAIVGLSALGCEPGGVGDPCIPEDEYRVQVAGYGVTEVNVESRSFQCETRVCLVNHFQGRVSCPYGQSAETAAECADASANGACQERGDACRVPGTNGSAPEERIQVPVDPQLIDRRTDDAVYCSCRCDGPDKNARYCECPSGFACVELVEELNLGMGQGAGNLAGSYCIKDGSRYDNTQSGGTRCDPVLANCGNDGNNP